MLTIQRASAGSGKTYTLAGKYILNLLAYQSSGGNWKLRNEPQINDALRHILAITFTNKATNEMKKRIVSNLSILAECDKTENPDSAPYFSEIQKLTNADKTKIAETSKIALKTILNNYSWFKISTIDSFFQEILRTFTYEANITDSYQLELDSKYVTDEAFVAAIHELDLHPERMGNSKFWLKTLMKNEAIKNQRWNPFSRQSNSNSIYAKIKKALTQLEKEEFKDIKLILDEYFSKEGTRENLIKLYKKLEEEAIKERDSLLKKIKQKASAINAIIFSGNVNIDHISKKFPPQIPKIEAMGMNDKVPCSYNGFIKDQTVFLKKFRTTDHPLDLEAMKMYEYLDEWGNPPIDSYFKAWTVYSSLLPYLGLLLEIRKFLSEVLEANNLIQISDTGYILKRIIGEEDAPFVYERLGTRLDNYFIDEFQDTSKLQWEIIRPLLGEGLSKDRESLIIGDPKQSIYRFRNANHTLITKVVPETFPHHPAGYSKEENTNWRSHTNIVKFNNYFFKQLAAITNDLSANKGGNTDFDDLYSNVVQYPHNQKGAGYVEIRVFSESTEENDSANTNEGNDDSPDPFDIRALNEVPSLLASLKERGYKEKDIAVLVNTNDMGKEVVNALLSYNATEDSPSKRINFISEESLLISSSPAISIIVEVLQKIVKPGTSINQKEERDNVSEDSKDAEGENKSGKREYKKWEDIKLGYTLFSLKHKNLDKGEKILTFLKESKTDQRIFEVMKELAVPTLTGIVETIIKEFLDEGLKKSEAIYISSFLDAVNEYSVGHHNDIASFLEWWKARGASMSISVPDNIDAVQIMTIHKSKGLEFKCVVIPFATQSFLPGNRQNKMEWRWVEPVDLKGIEFPPLLPVETSVKLIGSKHETLYKDYFDQILTDKLNMFYVAFTRAKNELYIFTKETKKAGYTLSHFIKRILKDNDLPQIFTEEEKDSVAEIGEFIISEDNGFITYGSPFSTEEIKNEYAQNVNEKTVEIRIMEGIKINKKRPVLRSRASTMLPSEE